MREILADLRLWEENDEEIALATLVRVRGSAPRPVGARLGVTRSGRLTGSVTGGCVEGDVFERAMRVLDCGKPVIATYGVAEESGFEVGLSCGGSIDVLIEPLPTCDAWRAIAHALEDQQPVALATGLEPEALLSSKMTVLGDGETVGSIDDQVDRHVIAEGRRCSSEGGTRLLRVPWRGKEASVLVEGFAPQLRLFIVGATHTAVVLCRMAKEVGFRVIVIDARAAFATGERFPEADEIHRAWPEDVLNQETLDASSFVVVLTHDPKFDIPALTRALRSGARYVGLVGSAATQAKRRAQLTEDGLAENQLARIRGPIGLDIGARTPEEMALAILAEMLAVRYGREGGPLKKRRAPINADS